MLLEITDIVKFNWARRWVRPVCTRLLISIWMSFFVALADWETSVLAETWLCKHKIWKTITLPVNGNGTSFNSPDYGETLDLMYICSLCFSCVQMWSGVFWVRLLWLPHFRQVSMPKCMCIWCPRFSPCGLHLVLWSFWLKNKLWNLVPLEGSFRVSCIGVMKP